MAKDASQEPGAASESILITGGLGFIGSNLAIALEKNCLSTTLIDSLNNSYGGNLRNIDQPNKSNHLKINISDVRDEHSLLCLRKDTSTLYNLVGRQVTWIQWLIHSPI